MADTETIGLRTGLTESGAEFDKRQYNRELGDIMKTVDDYRFIQCDCGIKLKNSTVICQ